MTVRLMANLGRFFSTDEADIGIASFYHLRNLRYLWIVCF